MANESSDNLSPVTAISGPDKTGDSLALPPSAAENSGDVKPGGPPEAPPNPENASSPPTQTVTGADLVTGESAPAPAPATAPGEAPAKPGKRGRPAGSKTKVFRPGGPQDTPERRAALAAGELEPVRPVAPDFSDITGPGNFADLANPPAPAPPDYGKLAEMLFDMSASGLTIVLGPEWQPQNKEERGAVVESLRVYMAAKQMKDIPPGYLLAIVLLSYAGPRLQVPNTKAKLLTFWLWSRDKVLKPIRGFFGRLLGGANYRPAVVSFPSAPSAPAAVADART